MGILDRFSLTGKTALVTGAGRGLGQGMALALAEAGADIAIAELDLPAAEETAAEVGKRGRKALSFKADVTDFDSVQAMFKSAVEEWGHLDILVNNAGYAQPDVGPGDERPGLGSHAGGGSEGRVPVLQGRRTVHDQAGGREDRQHRLHVLVPCEPGCRLLPTTTRPRPGW